MKDFMVINNDADYAFHFPTSISEIDTEYLSKLTDHVHLAPYHILIGLVYKDSLSNIILTYKQKKAKINLSVTPIFIKAGKDTDIDADIKDILVIPPTSLQLGYGINIPANELSLDRFTAILDGDNEAYKRIMGNDSKVCFVDFKIIPVNEIKGVIKRITERIEYKYVNVHPKDGSGAN